MRSYGKLFLIIFIIFLINTVYADKRNYIWTYQYNTLSKAETELEIYQTTLLANTNIWEYRLEVEHGFTERLDFSVYQIFRQKQKEAFRWDAVQFRLRYRFGEAGQYFLDPLLYVEYRYRTDSSLPQKAEVRLVLAKQIESFNIALNPLYEYFFRPGSIHETGMDAGISYEFSSYFVLGAEASVRTVFLDSGIRTGIYIGPTVSLASGEWWYAFGVGFGLFDTFDTMRVRFIMGIEL